MTASTVARPKITLEDVRPPVQRRVEVPVKIRLDRLHLVFQAALGWTNSHLYEIRAGDVGWGMVGAAGRDPNPSARSDRGRRRQNPEISYDFGDGWEHTIKIERIADAIPGLPYPVLLDATGHCPPEDVGGPWGYSELLEVLVDPDHERHYELMEWVGGPFDPRTCDVDQLAKSVDALARKWTRKPTAQRKTRQKSASPRTARSGH